MDCLKSEVERLDDGVTDPVSIGHIVAPACHRHLRMATYTMSQHENANVRQQLYERRLAQSASDAARAVLVHRRASSSQP